MSYPDSFPKHFIGISTSILTMQGSTTHVIVWKIRVILLQIFAWIVACESQRTFNRVFKERYKISPSDYRSTCVKDILS